MATRLSRRCASWTRARWLHNDTRAPDQGGVNSQPALQGQFSIGLDSEWSWPASLPVPLLERAPWVLRSDLHRTPPTKIGIDRDGILDRRQKLRAAAPNPNVSGPRRRKPGAKMTSLSSLWSGTLETMTTLTWPTLNPQDQWLIDGLEKDLLETNQTPEELRAEARSVRAEAEQTDIKAYREVCLTMAANYELIAAERLAA